MARQASARVPPLMIMFGGALPSIPHKAHANVAGLTKYMGNTASDWDGGAKSAAAAAAASGGFMGRTMTFKKKV